MILRYRRAVREGYLSEAADLYPAYVAAHNRLALIGCIVLSVIGIAIPAYLYVS